MDSSKTTHIYETSYGNLWLVTGIDGEVESGAKRIREICKEADARVPDTINYEGTLKEHSLKSIHSDTFAANE